MKSHTPGAPLTYFNDGGVRRRFIFYTQKHPNFRICLPKTIPTFFSIPKKIPQCFCISKFYYLSSGKLKYANFNFGFGQKQNYKLRLCYFWFELMKNTIPKKIPLLFSRPKKIPASFDRPKKIPFGQNVRPHKILRTPLSLKYVSGAPGSHTRTPAYVVLNDLRLIHDMTFKKMLTSRLKMQKVPFRPVRDARFNLFSLSSLFLISETEKCICNDLI